MAPKVFALVQLVVSTRNLGMVTTAYCLTKADQCRCKDVEETELYYELVD